MNVNFNPRTLFENIEFLLKTQGRKIGEVENAVGVSAGYISRNSKENSSKPGIEFIVNIARELNVSLDTLLTVNLVECTPTEQYLISFIDKLKNDTERDELAWNKEVAQDLNSVPVDENGIPNHPLFVPKEKPVDDGTYFDVPYESYFPSHSYGKDTLISGDCFDLSLKNYSKLYLMAVTKVLTQKTDAEIPSDKEEQRDTGKNKIFDPLAIELWMDLSQGPAQYLCSTRGNPSLRDKILILYSTVSENSNHPHVKKDVRYIIDSFMKNDIENDSLDAPPF